MESSPPGTHGMEASNKNILKWVGFTAAALGLAFLLYVGTYAWKWDWTGIGPQPALTSGHIRVSIGQTSKTLWDVLQLLGVPLVLVILANLLTRSQKERELEIANEQRRVEQGIARDQRTTEQEIARDQRAVEQRIADERLQEETLNAYLGRMADLLLHERLHESQAEDDVRAVARARTLMTLRRLDARRKGIYCVSCTTLS